MKTKKQLVAIVAVLLLSIPLAYAGVRCYCSIYNSPHMSYTEAVVIEQTPAGNDVSCNAGCYVSGLLRSECYEDGRYFSKFDCGEGSVFHDCGRGGDECSVVDEGSAAETSGLYNFFAEDVNKDADQLQCTSFIYQTPDNIPRAWHSMAPDGYKCCGDDIEGDDYSDSPTLDGATITTDGASICAKDTDGLWQWFNKDAVIGDIFTIPYGNYDLVAARDPDTEEFVWTACDANGGVTSNFDRGMGNAVQEGEDVLAGHYYICYDNGGIGQFAECVGYGQSNNKNKDTYGKVLRTGEYIELSNGELRFCTDQYRWINDLDGSNRQTCENSGMMWTGSKCCGDDADDTYNDIGWQYLPENERGSPIGGCFKNLKVDSDSAIADSNLVNNGNFEQGMAPWETEGFATLTSAPRQLKLERDSKAYQDITRLIRGSSKYIFTAKINNVNANVKASVFADGEEIAGSVMFSEGYSEDTITKNFTTPDTFSKIEVFLQALPSSPANSWAYLDDIELNFANKKIMNFEGEFHSCNLDDEEREDYWDTDAGSLLIPEERNMQLCSILGSHFCSESFGWESPNEIGGKLRNTSSTTPEGYEQSSTSCCPPDYCWNGTSCTESEHYSTEPVNPIIIGDDQLYRCVHGEWDLTVIRWTWDHKEYGYCPELSDCIVDKEGDADSNYKPAKYKGPYNTDNPQCIASGQFIEDHYCDNGTWSTRTKLAAITLLDVLDKRGNKEEYTLFCGNYSSAINRYDYQTPSGNLAEDYLRGKLLLGGPALSIYSCSGDPIYELPCVNNFCILRYHDSFDDKIKIAAATSINQPVDAEELSFLELLNKENTYCNTLSMTESGFGKCGEDNTIWYSNMSGIIIFSPQGLELEDPGFWESFINWLANPIQSLLGAINPSALDVMPLAYKAIAYDNIYADINGDKAITAIFEPYAENPFIAANYSGFSQDICISIEEYDKKRFQDIGAIECNQTEEDQFSIYTQGRKAFGMWTDLTSRSRIGGKFYAGESSGFEKG